MKMRYCLLPLVLYLSLIGFAQTKDEVRRFSPTCPSSARSRAASRTSIKSASRRDNSCFRLEQRAVDAVLILTAPDGKQLVAMNLTRAGEQESLSLETTAAGKYRLVVRGNGTAIHQGRHWAQLASGSAAGIC
jgi:hypothetical protein